MTGSRRQFLKRSITAAGLGISAIAGAEPQELLTSRSVCAVELPRIRVAQGGHYLETEHGARFFWLGDTAWQLIHSTTQSECSYYLATRASQGFTVIQACVLAEMDGIRKPSALGLRPFHKDDPSHPDEDYFNRVAEIVREAASLGLYVALLPTWGDKLTASDNGKSPSWGAGPRVFRTDNLGGARDYGRYLGKKFATDANLVWMLGGDRPARIRGASTGLKATAQEYGISPDTDWTPVWEAMAQGLAEGLGRTPVTLYHPQGGAESTSVLLHDASWLSINGMQSGHGGGHDSPVWDFVARDFTIVPAKPTLDLEPNYEDHPYNPWPSWDPAAGYFRDYDVRKQLYRSVFAGACGVTYGHHAVWQFANARNGVINHADRDWIRALYRPAGTQAIFLRRLIESRPSQSRIPDQTLLKENSDHGPDHALATRDEEGTYLFAYFPRADFNAVVDLTTIRGPQKRGWWFDPRTGVGVPIDQDCSGPVLKVKTPPLGPDTVLVIDSTSVNYGPPGLSAITNLKQI